MPATRSQKGRAKRARDSDGDYTDEELPKSNKRPARKEAKASPAKAAVPGATKAWKAALPPPWNVEDHPGYRHPDGARTHRKAHVHKLFNITKEDVETLPYETRPNPNPAYPNPIYLYAQADLADLSKRKSEALGKEYAPMVKLLEEQAASAAGEGHNAEAATKITSLSTAERDVALIHQDKWLRDLAKAKAAPIKISHDYTPPSDLETPDPPNVDWLGTGVVGPYRAKDVCLMFCIEPSDISDLTADTEWLDPKTVAMRAVQIHGGFYAHATLVLNKIREEIRSLKANNKTKSSNKFSTTVSAQLSEPGSDPLHFDHEVWNKKPKDWERKRVLTYRPPKMVDREDSADVQWYPPLDD